MGRWGGQGTAVKQGEREYGLQQHTRCKRCWFKMLASTNLAAVLPAYLLLPEELPASVYSTFAHLHWLMPIHKPPARP